MSSDLMTISQTSREFPIFTEAALRSLISRATMNGLSKAILRVRGRVYLIKTEFRSWVESSTQELI